MFYLYYQPTNQPKETMNQLGPWSSLGTHGSLVVGLVMWVICISSSGETWKFDFWGQIWPRRSRSIAPPTHKKNRDLNQGILHLWSKFGDPSLNGWGVMVWTSSKWGKFGLSSCIWPWRSRSITSQNKRDLNQGLLHLWSTFGNPSLNGSQVITQRSIWLTDRHTHRCRQWQYPKANTRLG